MNEVAFTTNRGSCRLVKRRIPPLLLPLATVIVLAVVCGGPSHAADALPVEDLAARSIALSRAGKKCRRGYVYSRKTKRCTKRRKRSRKKKKRWT